MKMKKLALVGLASLLPASGAMADENWYFGLRGGLSSAEKSSLDNGVNGLRGHSKHSDGFAFSAAAGYDFGAARLEGEILRIENDVDQYGFANDGGLGAAALGFNSATTGKTGATLGMLNIYYDIETGTGLTPYLGAGVGWGRIGYNNYEVNNVPIVNRADEGVAYQLIAGLSAAVSDAIDVTADYRYLGADERDLSDALGRPLEADYSTHLFMVGLVWKFGGKQEVASTPEPSRTAVLQEPEPAPEAGAFEALEPAAGPEPAPEPVGPFMVYFDWDSAELSADARAEIAEAADAFKAEAPVQLLLKGHADTSGPDYYNNDLSKRRAAAVRAALEAEGVPADSIDTWGYGEGDLAVWTEDNVRERMNRRVEIIFE